MALCFLMSLSLWEFFLNHYEKRREKKVEISVEKEEILSYEFVHYHIAFSQCTVCILWFRMAGVEAFSL